MASPFGKKLVTAVAYGFVTGTVLYMVGAAVNAFVSAISPLAAFAVGFGSAIAIALARDEDENKQ